MLFIGTATVYLEISGLKILVDPSFYHANKTIHLGWGLRSKRLIPPAIDISDLPKPNMVLISHTHKDHWDDEAKAGIDRDTKIITNQKAAIKLQRDGSTKVIGLSNGESHQQDPIKIKALPAQHGPKFMIPFTGSVIGFGIETKNGNIWISGDTIGTKSLDLALEEFDPKIGIVYFGGVRYILPKLTFDAKNGKQTVEKTEMDICYPVHFDDWSHFRTTRAQIEKEFSDISTKLVFPPRGETIDLWK
ncbi:MAG: hypothetical protein HeimC2_35910 [Candidatus Heimdallarchaeota archaeon LC_2]|nr:MAG: hypothetical protein HeimC2_35910 [Candidatus Heimdallarchaeota archaeon LC_2]